MASLVSVKYLVGGCIIDRTETSNDEVACSSIQGRILTMVSENPGITFGKILDFSKVGSGTASYHLNKLEAGRALISKKCGRKRKYWAADSERLHNILNLSEPCQKIINLFGENDCTPTVGEIASKIKTSSSRICYHLRILECEGIIKRTRVGRKTYCIFL